MRFYLQSFFNRIFFAGLLIAICVFSLAGFSDAVQAADVTLAWDANSETNLAGYKLYYDGDSDTEQYQGVGAAEGDSPVVIYLEDLDDPNNPTYTLTELEDGQYYYFALTAFDTDGRESDFSEEIGFNTPSWSVISDSESTGKFITADATSDSSGAVSSGSSGCFITMAADHETHGSTIPVLSLLLGATAVMVSRNWKHRSAMRAARDCHLLP